MAPLYWLDGVRFLLWKGCDPPSRLPRPRLPVRANSSEAQHPGSELRSDTVWAAKPKNRTPQDDNERDHGHITQMRGGLTTSPPPFALVTFPFLPADLLIIISLRLNHYHIIESRWPFLWFTGGLPTCLGPHPPHAALSLWHNSVLPRPSRQNKSKQH